MRALRLVGSELFFLIRQIHLHFRKHASTNLIAKDPSTNANVSSADQGGATPSKKPRLNDDD